jgi:hypothetical protein
MYKHAEKQTGSTPWYDSIQTLMYGLTSTLKTTISPARIGSLFMCKNRMSPCKQKKGITEHSVIRYIW